MPQRRRHRRAGHPGQRPARSAARDRGPLRTVAAITASRVADEPIPRHPEAHPCVCPACSPPCEATAHCDLPCGVYDPAQARIEAESVKAIIEKYQGNDDPDFRTRAILIKEQRAELVKHHLWVLWTDYFKPPHFEKYPQLHELFNEATKLAGAAGTKGSHGPGRGPEAARQDRRDRQDLLGDQGRRLTSHVCTGAAGPPSHGRPGSAVS